MPDFEEEHARLLERHLSKRSGERRGRLLRGHQHAEKLLLQNVWWPLFGSFDHLHPEYEIHDWNRKSQFLDFAFLPPYGRFGLECDGYQSHIKDMDRESFSYSLNRDTYLTGMGWKMIHFSFDDVQKRPDVCRMLLQLVIGPHLIRTPASLLLSPDEKDVLRFAIQLGKPIRTRDVMLQYQINFRTARKHLHNLSVQNLLRPIKPNSYVSCYEVTDRAVLHVM
ncbi:hypothetical protein [Paenibacillus sp. CF384]|uniref:hypothetical protein n=1 Tax=Paenibacillus sp. CF384 TaxID=1884382 RepID=UPI00089D6939|nr:hypothetical protein [Paenibacillus sp. CF384]SDX38550.1 hypothetical protein SAMN05518855_101343 [Paenibacillus sp. CF384]